MADIVTNTSVVDNEGNIVLAGVGKIKAIDLSLNELRKKIKDLMQQLPDSQNAFQIQITNFTSQTAFLSIAGKESVVVPITATPKTILAVLTEYGVSLENDNITRINLKRGRQNYQFSMDNLITKPQIYISSLKIALLLKIYRIKKIKYLYWERFLHRFLRLTQQKEKL